MDSSYLSFHHFSRGLFHFLPVEHIQLRSQRKGFSKVRHLFSTSVLINLQEIMKTLNKNKMKKTLQLTLKRSHRPRQNVCLSDPFQRKVCKDAYFRSLHSNIQESRFHTLSRRFVQLHYQLI